MQHFTSLQVRRLPREVIFLVFTCEINDKQNLNKTIAVTSTTKSRDLAISLKGGPACTIEKYPCSCLRFSFIPGDFHSCWNRRLTQRLAEIIDMENRAVHVWAAERRSLCSVCVIRQKPLRESENGFGTCMDLMHMLSMACFLSLKIIEYMDQSVEWQESTAGFLKVNEWKCILFFILYINY